MDKTKNNAFPIVLPPGEGRMPLAEGSKIINFPRGTLVEGEKEEFRQLTVETGECNDELDPLKRKLLMAAAVYGIENPRKIANQCEIPLSVVEQVIENKNGESNWFHDSLRKNDINCFTKAELVARLCIEAENGKTGKDRIAALTKLMEFRGMTVPEGGARSFSRTVLRFKRIS